MTPKALRGAVRATRGKIQVQTLGLTLTIEKSSLIEALNGLDANTETDLFLSDAGMLGRVGSVGTDRLAAMDAAIPPDVRMKRLDEIEPSLPFEDMI